LPKEKKRGELKQWHEGEPGIEPGQKQFTAEQEAQEGL